MDTLGDAVMSEEGSNIEYRPLPSLAWKVLEDDKQNDYCYMCQKPGKDGSYSEEYKSLKSLLDSAVSVDQEKVCNWAAAYYNEFVYKYTGKPMSAHDFLRHFTHDINPLQVQTTLVRTTMLMLDEYMKEAQEVDVGKGTKRGALGERAKTIQAQIKLVSEQNMLLYRMRKHSMI